tara:strand:+ start:342 stop:689 length:348 start_codon:yes stop_codon:yes gene_type:complete
MTEPEAQLERLQKTKERLHQAAEELSLEMGGAPIVVVAGGSADHGVEATVAGWANLSDQREGRFRDVVGILQSAIQLESFFHYMEDDLFQNLKENIGRRSWLSAGGSAPSSKSDT